MPGEPMTEAEARERIARGAVSYVQTHNRWPDLTPTQIAEETADVILRESIRHHPDALAVLLDPETMLRAWEKLGKVEKWHHRDTGTTNPWCWRTLPDKEGAT